MCASQLNLKGELLIYFNDFISYLWFYNAADSTFIFAWMHGTTTYS